jgi:putative transcriptional regulator
MNNRVRELRSERGWSQTVLTIKTRLTQSILSRIENGKLEPHPGWKRRIARAFGLSVESVFGEKKKKNRKVENGRAN